ncbi:MAG: endonuclease III [Thermoanaerobaculum sp.]
MTPQERARKVAPLLAHAYPEARCELDHRNAYELLVATILSAQCTDARVNQVTPAFFARFPNAQALAQARQEEVEELIKSTGFYRNKAKALLGMAKALVERHGGEVPRQMEAMVQLPGVGRKTANVVLGTAYGLATGIVVDTHVTRVSQRLGLTTQSEPEKIERELMALFPREEWVALSHRLILHGRYVCKARKPACGSCLLAEICPRVGV